MHGAGLERWMAPHRAGPRRGPECLMLHAPTHGGPSHIATMDNLTFQPWATSLQSWATSHCNQGGGSPHTATMGHHTLQPWATSHRYHGQPWGRVTSCCNHGPPHTATKGEGHHTLQPEATSHCCHGQPHISTMGHLTLQSWDT